MRVVTTEPIATGRVSPRMQMVRRTLVSGSSIFGMEREIEPQPVANITREPTLKAEDMDRVDGNLLMGTVTTMVSGQMIRSTAMENS